MRAQLIDIVVQEKPTQHCKITPTLIEKKKKKPTCLPLKGQFKCDFLHEDCRSRVLFPLRSGCSLYHVWSTDLVL